jgi:hypothetical protein
MKTRVIKFFHDGAKRFVHVVEFWGTDPTFAYEEDPPKLVDWQRWPDWENQTLFDTAEEASRIAKNLAGNLRDEAHAPIVVAEFGDE